MPMTWSSAPFPSRGRSARPYSAMFEEDYIRPSVSSFDPSEPSRRRSTRSRSNKRGNGGYPQEKTAFSRIVQLCVCRDRSRQELKERLVEDGYDEREAEDALDRACSCNLVNDMRFAEAFVRARVHAGKGIPGIERDLERYGINAHELPRWPHAYGLDPDTQLEAALDLLDQHPPASKNRYAGAYRKLLSKGYDGGIAASAARVWAMRG